MSTHSVYILAFLTCREWVLGISEAQEAWYHLLQLLLWSLCGHSRTVKLPLS